jgi:hypothetical protein
MVSAAVAALALSLQILSQVSASPSTRDVADDTARSSTLEDAQRSFYNGDYARAATISQTLCASYPDDLAACELRTGSLHFEMKKALAATGEREKRTAWKRCASCPALLSAFLADIARGQAMARARLDTFPDQEEALFYLGKLDLNYVWLQSGTLGRKTGLNEYREGRRALDRVLRLNPDHVRARVARAWVDYIVGTTVPRGVRWMLGGGNKDRGLQAVGEVVGTRAGSFFDRAEAMFALWDMQVRERDVTAAVVTARTLAGDFPDNRELRRFLMTHDPGTLVTDPGRRVP